MNEWTKKYDKFDQNFILVEWDKLKKQLAALKEEELDLRKYIVNRAFPDKHEGANTQDLGNGYKLKSTIKYNYILDKDNIKIEKALDELSKIDNQGSFIADRLISWHPTLCLQEYRELESKYKIIIDKVITITDGASTLEIKAPKEKK
jgi:hypothetical protein